MADAKTYTGGCHCGKVKYRVTTDLGRVMECNCSICSKKGYLLNFVPSTQFELLSGEDALVDYQFNKHVVHHNFCGTCGIQSFARGERPDGTKMIAVNVRCLDDLDLATVERTFFDGKSLK
jgi:hypothetical protein